MERTEDYFLALTDEQQKNEITVLFQLLKEEKIPKSMALAKILLKFPNEITPYIFDLFESDNMIMKAWSLENVIPQLPFFVKIALEDALQRIAQSPSEEEQSVGLNEKAKNVLNGFI